MLAFLLFMPATSMFAQELPTAKPQDVGMSADKLNEIALGIGQMIEKKQTAGAVVLIARHGKICYVEAFGKRNVEFNQAMTVDDLFRIYSMTKPITSVATMILVEEGKLKLDDPVSKYLPELACLQVLAGEGEKTVPSNRDITIRDLLSHTSGLSYGMQPTTPIDKLYAKHHVMDHDGTIANMVTRLSKLPLRNQPGEQFNYSVSTDVLGRVIEVASSQTLDVFLRERIFVPLDMKHTGFAVPKENQSLLAAAYRREGSKLTNIDQFIGRWEKMPKFLSGGGGLVSTARDYARFCQMILGGGELFGKRILRTETVREMTTNQLPAESLPMKVVGFPQPGRGFGLGFSGKLPNDIKKPFEDEFGWSGYASTDFWISPQRDLFVISMQQLVPTSPVLSWSLRPIIHGAVEK